MNGAVKHQVVVQTPVSFSKGSGRGCAAGFKLWRRARLFARLNPDAPAEAPLWRRPLINRSTTLPFVQMDPKFLRNLRFSKKWNGKGRGGEDDDDDDE